MPMDTSEDVEVVEEEPSAATFSLPPADAFSLLPADAAKNSSPGPGAQPSLSLFAMLGPAAERGLQNPFGSSGEMVRVWVSDLCNGFSQRFSVEVPRSNPFSLKSIIAMRQAYGMDSFVMDCSEGSLPPAVTLKPVTMATPNVAPAALSFGAAPFSFNSETPWTFSFGEK